MVSFFIFIFMLNGFDPAASESPKEETIVGDYKLELFETGENYEVSKKVCEDRDAWLVEIKDEDIEAAVKSLRSSHSLWIGLKFTNGGWKWSDGTLLKYANWLNAPTSRTTCVEMDFKSGLWSTKGCTSPTRYVCQSDINYPGSSTFSISSTKLTRSKAEEKCESNDSRLVDVKTPGFNSVIKEKLKNFYRGNENSERYYWTSGNDIETERTWKWGDETLIDGSTADWAENEPNTKTGHDCLAIYMGSSQAWVGMTCSAEHKYICYKNVTSGDCLKNVCLNGGTCAVSKRRYSCSCPAGYFGTKCEKELIKVIISTASKVVKKGQDASVTLDIISYDGDATVVVTSNVTFNRNENVEISKPGTSKIINLSLREQLASAKYTFSVTSQSNPDSYRREVNAEVLVKDHCTSSPCQNGGTCRFITSDPYFNCTCDPAYEGAVCESASFTEFKNCTYHINRQKSLRFDVANSACNSLGATLAMMKSDEVQSNVEKQFIDQYEDTTKRIELWIGGHKIDNTWYWLDGTAIPLDPKKSKIKLGRDFVILSNHGNQSINNMRWYSKTRNSTTKGFVCEKSVKSPCVEIICLHGGSCVELGCQANCKCAPGYHGNRCANDLIQITAMELNHTVKIGQTVNVTLKITSEDGLVRIEVFKGSNTTELRAINVSDSVTITIGPFTRSTAGEKYQFRASPEEAPGSYYKDVNVSITVEEPASLQITPMMLALPHTFERFVTCEAEGFPKPVAVWKRNGIDVATGDSNTVYQTRNGSVATLYFTTRAKTEIGNYTCFAKNLVLGSERKTSGIVFIRGKILPVSRSHNFTDSAFETATMSCTFEGFPEPHIYWKWGENETGSKDVESWHDPGKIFSFASVTEPSSLLFRKTSTINIKLAEYLDSTTIYCYARNEHEIASAQSFSLNQNLVIGEEKSYRIYNVSDQNFTEAITYCQSKQRNLVKIFSNETHKMLANKLKALRSATNIFVGARRHSLNDTKLWKWNNNKVLYNETKNGSYNKSSVGIVDGKFVAWRLGEPSGAGGSCVVMSRSASWLWTTVGCSDSNGFICESDIAGIPKNFSVYADECSANVTVSIEAASLAIGVTHRIDISHANASDIERTSDEIPNSQYPIMKQKYTNLHYDEIYKVKITVCPECPRPFSTSKQIQTYALVQANNLTFSLANMSVVSDTCRLMWDINNTSSRAIIGFKISGYSVLAQEVFEKHLQPRITLGYNLSLASRHHVHKTLPNRNYTFQISVITCMGIGPAFKIDGECITESAAPSIVPVSTISSESNDDNTMNIKIKIPVQSNGSLSCIFIVVTYKPTGENETLPKYEKEDLLKAALKSTEASLSPGDSYLAVAITRADIMNVGEGEDYLTRKLGDESQTACDILGTTPNRRKRSTSSDGNIKANNRKLEDEAEYKYFTVTTTPGTNEIHFQTSDTSLFKMSRLLSSAGLVAGIVVSVILIICLTAVGLYMKRKLDLKRSLNTDIRLQEMEGNVERYHATAIDVEKPRLEMDIFLEELQAVYGSKLANDGSMFSEEFDKLKENAETLNYPTEIASKLTLKKKNRYKNILPSDKSRVLLGGNVADGYINACYVDGFQKPKKFIATQGPLPSTVDDFWQMIVEQKCTTIVMLTKCNEKGKVKCEKYWPDLGLFKDFNTVNVENIEEASFGCFTIRTFEINSDVQNLTVKQFHFLSWPDHGVPSTTTNIIRFHRAVTELQSTAPIVVHCSAGAGRTGAFIAYDFLLHEAESLSSIDVYHCVIEMREQRVDMVQTCDQYILVHKMLLEHHLFGNTDRDTHDVEDAFSDDSSIKKEFDSLSVVLPINNQKHGDALKNISHNRNQEIVPYEHNKLVVLMKNDESSMPYINASTVEMYDSTMKVIAVQAPLSTSVDIFWRAVLDNNVNTIVMLTKCLENKKDQSAQYWPEENEGSMSVGKLTIGARSAHSTGNIVERELEISSGEDEKTIMQYQYIGWSSDQCPSNASDVLELVEKMHSSLRKDKDAAAMVLCSDGAGRSGTFCAIANIIERVKLENKIDIFRAVKDLRDCRPGMVQNLDQYRFCYEAVSAYLSSFSLYSNFDHRKQAAKQETVYENWS